MLIYNGINQSLNALICVKRSEVETTKQTKYSAVNVIEKLCTYPVYQKHFCNYRISALNNEYLPCGPYRTSLN